MRRLLLYLFLMSQFLGTGLAQQQAVAPAKASAVTAQTPSAESIWADLMDGNQRFVSGKTKAVDVVTLRNTLVKEQRPKVVVVACSDSRVSPEIVFDKNLGDIFVVESAGNVVGPIGVGSIEYAVEHLGSSVLVVLGHQGCGAVAAACSGEKMPSTNLQAIVDKILPAVTRAKMHAKADDVVEAAILENIHQSAEDILAGSEVLQHFLHDGKLTVFEAIYELGSGQVVKLRALTGDH
ncbi:MAG: carbonic anhydrase [Candidatus Sulfotelmatobacter sp.]